MSISQEVHGEVINYVNTKSPTEETMIPLFTALVERACLVVNEKNSGASHVVKAIVEAKESFVSQSTASLLQENLELMKHLFEHSHTVSLNERHLEIFDECCNEEQMSYSAFLYICGGHDNSLAFPLLLIYVIANDLAKVYDNTVVQKSSIFNRHI